MSKLQTPQRALRQQDQFEKFNNKCVCEICTCGKHHCPPEPTKFVGETTNHHDFKPYNITTVRKQQCPHQYHQRHYDPQVMKTSYKKDYQPFKVTPHLHSTKHEYKRNNQPFYDQTEYKKSFLPHQVVVQRPNTCVHPYQRNKAKFQGSTTYHDEYSPKKVEQTKPIQAHYQRKHIPFTGETVYNSQYKKHQIQVQRPQVYPQDYPRRQNKFMGQSRYNEEYKPYQIQKAKICPIEVMPSRPTKCSPEKHHVNYSAQKHRWE